MRYLSLKEVVLLHKYLAKQSSGTVTIRDLGLLQSGIEQPKATYAGKPLYPTLHEKAAALCFSLVKNHPFLDGNKRVGHAALETFLVLNGFELSCSVDEQESKMLDVAAGAVPRDALAGWVKSHMRRIRR